MSDQYSYCCSNCDFQIWTDEYGSECITLGSYQFYKCSHCDSLLNLWQYLKDFLEYKNQDLIPKYWLGSNFTESLIIKDTCPLCGAKESLIKWKPNDGCPKCGHSMFRDWSKGCCHSD